MFDTNGLWEIPWIFTTRCWLHSSIRPCKHSRGALCFRMKSTALVDRVAVTGKWKKGPSGPHWLVWPVRPVVPFPVQHPPYPHCKPNAIFFFRHRSKRQARPTGRKGCVQLAKTTTTERREIFLLVHFKTPLQKYKIPNMVSFYKQNPSLLQ